MPFKAGAFLAGLPLKPIIIHYATVCVRVMHVLTWCAQYVCMHSMCVWT